MSHEQSHFAKWSALGAVLSAVAGSICCVGPLVLLVLGVGGAWASSLRAMEPYRPVFIVLTVGFLGFAFYRAYRKVAGAECAADGSCAVPRAARAGRIALWIITPIILALIAFPYLAPRLFTGSSTKGVTNVQTKRTLLNVDGMTCASCTVHVRESLKRVDGVQDANVTVDPPQAVVTYDPTKVSPDALAKATGAAGYSATVKR